MDNYTAAFPTILEIPSKEHPYGKSMELDVLLSDRSGEGQCIKTVVKSVGE